MRLALTILACIVAGLALAFALARVLTQEPMRSWNGTANTDVSPRVEYPRAAKGP